MNGGRWRTGRFLSGKGDLPVNGRKIEKGKVSVRIRRFTNEGR
jgi:hypothetical protein